MRKCIFYENGKANYFSYRRHSSNFGDPYCYTNAYFGRYSPINPSDKIQIEFTKHDLRIVSFGVTDKTIADNTYVLTIENDGTVQYTEIRDGVNKSQITSSISNEQLQKLSAMIKETGFMSIPKESFPIKDDVESYTKFTIKITLNDAKTQIFWPEQDATEKFIPPIVTMLESELEDIINQIREQ